VLQTRVNWNSGKTEVVSPYLSVRQPGWVREVGPGAQGKLRRLYPLTTTPPARTHKGRIDE